LKTEALNIRSKCSGRRIAFVSGNFNIVHPGHLRVLKFAADLADVLVVGLRPDSAPGVTMSGPLRLEGVKALSLVDHAILLDGDVTTFIAALQPEFVVKGVEFESGYNPEAAVVEGYGGELVFSSGGIQFSSSSLLRDEFLKPEPLPFLRNADGFPERYDLSAAAMRASLNKMSGMRVAVIGDIIVDDYILCDPLGMSQEDPTIVVTPFENQTFIGGAGIVAAHARSFGAEAHLLTVFGRDEAAGYARDSLGNMRVNVHGVVDETRPTTRKQRFRAWDKTLLRVNHLSQHAINKNHAQAILKGVIALLPKIDLLMFSDFNYGCLPQDLVDAICAEARIRGIPMAADSQASSQVSDITRFKGMSLITPTEREARLALRDTASGLAVLAVDLQEASGAENVLITLGESGMMVHGRGRDGEYVTDRLPALNSTPKDVAGAGDSVFAATSMAANCGGDIWLAAYLGTIAAAIQVSRVGNRPIDVGDILHEIGEIDRAQEE
jgi:rfaE bifunctional protein kinase chain/domain